MNFLKDSSLSTEEVAQRLLGCHLVCETEGQTTSGWIVETEAYVGVEDKAAHIYGGKKTPRVKAMYGEPGTIYVYQMMSHVLLNVITQEKGTPAGVLVRAVEPHQGIDVMEARRQKEGRELTNGPGKMTQAMGISMDHYGLCILKKPVYIDSTLYREPEKIDVTPRIGIPNKDQWTEAPLRYIVSGNPFVSHRRGKVSENNGWSN